MKTLKKLTISTLALAGFAVLANGGYNTVVMQDDSFMTASTDIKFAKRLDEIEGKVVSGRKAASITWKQIQPVEASAKTAAENEEEPKAQAPKAEKREQVATSSVSEPKIAEPAIKGDMEMTVSKIFYKNQLKEGSFSGSARTVDGIVEEIYVNLPNGDSIEINTRDRMQGNVFQYEDGETREMKSGLLYEVKPGTYMVTLANHSRYPGVRMEFKTAGGEQIAYGEDYYDQTQGWSMDSQNHSGELAGEGKNKEYQARGDDYEYQDRAAEEETYGFDFKS